MPHRRSNCSARQCQRSVTGATPHVIRSLDSPPALKHPAMEAGPLFLYALGLTLASTLRQCLRCHT
ncbi:hypothetical protein Hypma_005486 [Hypsizygus marmoreus]|uniref:Uncharacterized protein n=1 Tax=Hypsizygus marmoreus TaxID=39966 RepID=A0A369J3Q1_HYPMA|nr:hypothetical protein Hypma_005486 [Hypsizygus marmoreus]